MLTFLRRAIPSSMIVRATAFLVALAALILLVAWQSGEATHAGTGGDPRQGDADCSGSVDSRDAIMVLGHTAGLRGLSCTGNADANCDGRLDGLDVLSILRFSLGLSAPGAGGCPPIGGPSDSVVTGEQLIDTALGHGDISIDAATLYKAYWAFNDPRLPQEFKGTGRGADVPDDVWLRPPGLSATTNSELDKYLLPPPAPGSWYANASSASASLAQPLGPSPTVTQPGNSPPVPGEGWSAVTSVSGRVKVWWDAKFPDDEAKAQTYAVDVDVFWDTYKALMPKEPLSDGALSVPHGGDGIYDIYVVPLGSYLNGMVAPYQSKLLTTTPCPGLPTFMAINNAMPASDNPTLPHELLHSFQLALTYADSCENVGWLMEGTAKWSEDYIYPNANLEHLWPYFNGEHQKSLGSWDSLGYSSWLFFFYLARTGSPSVVGDIFVKAQTMEVMHAIDAAIPGGFQQSWPEFAKYAWNHAPFDQFQQWDGLSLQPYYRNLEQSTPDSKREPSVLSLAKNETRKEYTAVDTAVNPLALQYYLMALDTNVSYLTVNNPWGGQTPAGLKVQVAYSIHGEWSLIDISDKPSSSFCRHNPDQNVEEVILIVSNSQLPTSGPASPEFTVPVAIASDSCDGWHGTASISWVDGPPSAPRKYTMAATGLSFRKPDGGDGTLWQLDGGTVTWTVDLAVQLTDGVPQSVDDAQPQRIVPVEFCKYTGTASRPLVSGQGALHIVEAGAGSKYDLFGVAPLEVVAALSCRSDPGTAYHWFAGVWLCSQHDQSSANKTVVDGTYVFSTEDVSAPICPAQSSTEKAPKYYNRGGPREITYSWHLERLAGKETPAP